MKYQSYLVLGDWSKDGHNQSDKILLETNHPVEKLQQAYKDSCKLTGISFNINEDYTGLNRHWEIAEQYQIATGYESYSLTPECFAALDKFGFSKHFKVTSPDKFELPEQFTNLWLWFVKLSLPDLEATIVEDNTIPCINGYWNKNLNVSFGYGLYQ